jgi:hypothetical protein
LKARLGLVEQPPVEIAREFVALLDEIQDKNAYQDRARLDRLELLHARLRPAWEHFFGSFPIIDPGNYPPRVWHSRIRQKAASLLGHLEANPDWGAGAGQADFGLSWVPRRLLEHIFPIIQLAKATGKPTDWGRVTREATLFLETEIRVRSGLESKGRKDLASDAFKPGGPLAFKTNDAWQEGWKLYVMGILVAFGNPGAHTIRSHTESFAMGIVGAVSTVLVTLDDEFGPPATPRA